MAEFIFPDSYDGDHLPQRGGLFNETLSPEKIKKIRQRVDQLSIQIENSSEEDMGREICLKQKDYLLMILAKNDFVMFDTNGDGTISKAELKTLFQALDAETWTEDRVGKLLAEVDSNEDGAISYPEFFKWFMKGGDIQAAADSAAFNQAAREKKKRDEEWDWF
mmetsp:Transcript_159971/g.294916  ORF Transcript_159971/g.294916 Transcript_159971/m.294916 type:complete len:164 (-) Transcript_159971:105-596(-)